MPLHVLSHSMRLQGTTMTCAAISCKQCEATASARGGVDLTHANGFQLTYSITWICVSRTNGRGRRGLSQCKVECGSGCLFHASHSSDRYTVDDQYGPAARMQIAFAAVQDLVSCLGVVPRAMRK